jgi:DNA-directed RNA polymerase III subunit RPC3
MIPLKDARLALANLAKLHLIESLEVPRNLMTKQRVGSSTAPEHYIWSIDPRRVYSQLISDEYKAIGNLLQRRETEVDKRAMVLARESKAQAVGGREILSTKDREELFEMDDFSSKFLAGVRAHDAVVFLLRDLPGMEVERKKRDEDEG